MYIHHCAAYENIEVQVDAQEGHFNLSLKFPRKDVTLSVTLGGSQVAVVAAALIEQLTQAGETPDPLGIFGKAVQLGSQKNSTTKEAA